MMSLSARLQWQHVVAANNWARLFRWHTTTKIPRSNSVNVIQPLLRNQSRLLYEVFLQIGGADHSHLFTPGQDAQLCVIRNQNHAGMRSGNT